MISRGWLILALGAAGIGCATIAQSESGSRGAGVRIAIVPDSAVVAFVKPICGNLLTASLWTSTIFAYVAASWEQGDTAVIPAYLDAVVASDPSWEYPFEFGGLILSEFGRPLREKSIRFLREGVRRFPDRWKPRVYLAVILDQNGADPAEVAAPLMGLDSTSGLMPDYVRTLAFSILAKKGRGDQAGAAFLRSLREVEDPQIEELLLRRLARQLVKLKMARGDGLSDARALATILREGGPEERQQAAAIISRSWKLETEGGTTGSGAM